jgi:hypothetical protein
MHDVPVHIRRKQIVPHLCGCRTGLIILILSADYLLAAFDFVTQIAEYSAIDTDNIKIVFKSSPSPIYPICVRHLHGRRTKINRRQNRTGFEVHHHLCLTADIGKFFDLIISIL